MSVQILAEYLEYLEVEKGLSENTVDAYRRDLSDFWDFCASKNVISSGRLVIKPSNIPTIISTLKINISMSLIGVIMGELLVSKSGLGYLIMYGSQVFNINLVITGVVILGIISYIMYLIIDVVETVVKKKMGINT